MVHHGRTNYTQHKVGIIIIAVIISVLCMIYFLFILFTGNSFGGHEIQRSTNSYNLLDRFDNYITNLSSTALDGKFQVEKVYMLSDSDQVAPEPDLSNFTIASDPDELQFVIDTVSHRLNGENLLFSTQTPIVEGSSIHCYLDDTIFAVTWKQVLNNVVYTFSEVKIQHPSQFRRFLSDGFYGSDKQYLTSQMASSVNAVIASAGDFYKHRHIGLVVYNGNVERFEGNYLDNCFIDDQGDLLFTKPNDLLNEDDLQQYIFNHNIRFSLSFGPVLIDDGKVCVKAPYPIGEITGNYARSALCQMGSLHYVVVTANAEGKYMNFPTLFSFAETLAEQGIPKAYTLDGGQTATIVMNDQVINQVSYGSERYISDIIYFATAIPDTH